MAKFGRIEVGNKFRFYSQIFGFSKEFEVKSKNTEKFTYINEHGYEKDVFKQDCGNVVIVNNNIDQNELRDKIVRGATKALSEQLEKLNDPYYASMIAENIKNMEIELKIEFVSNKQQRTGKHGEEEMNENILNESVIKEDLSKCLNENVELKGLAKQAADYLKSKNFEVVAFDENMFDFKGKCKNEKDQEVESEGSIEVFGDGEISYSASHVIDGEEFDSIVDTIIKYDKIEDAVDCIVAPVF